jgi:D-alanine-D-alanine ligase
MQDVNCGGPGNDRRLRIAVFWRPGRNVTLQGRYLGQQFPDDAIEEAALHRDGLREAGHEADLVQWRPDDIAAMFCELRDAGYDLAFNASSLAEVAFLEALGLPYCGSGLDLVALDKAARKKLWVYHGVPTAPFFVVDRPRRAGGHVLALSEISEPGWRPPSPLDYPLFVKPVRGRGSAGITDDSIVTDQAGLGRQAASIIDRLDQGALVESYLVGREVTVGILGDPPMALTPLEIEYNQARTNTYLHKQDNEIMHCPARLSPARLARVKEVALEAFLAAGARDYGRVDTIVNAAGEPVALEINTFAGLQIVTGDETHLHASYIGTAAKAMGMTRADVLGSIVAAARRRLG